MYHIWTGSRRGARIESLELDPDPSSHSRQDICGVESGASVDCCEELSEGNTTNVHTSDWLGDKPDISQREAKDVRDGLQDAAPYLLYSQDPLIRINHLQRSLAKV